MKRTLIIGGWSATVFSVFAAALYFAAQTGAGQQAQPATLGKYVDNNGTIHLPEGYRLKWVHLGSWFVDGKQVHDVYTAPEVVEAYRH